MRAAGAACISGISLSVDTAGESLTSVRKVVRRYMSFGLFLGKSGDHFLGPYSAHVTHITGMEIVAEKLGLVRSDDSGKLDTVQAAQDDHDGDGIPSAAPGKHKPNRAGVPPGGGGAMSGRASE